MADPVTIGTLVASVLSMAGEAMLKGAIGEAAKDAYKTLKEKLSHRAGNDLTELEKAPDSVARRAVIAETVDHLSPEDGEELRAPTQMLVGKLREEAPAIGLDVGRLHALEVQLGNITVTHGIGARIGDAELPGTFRTGEIVVGDSPGKR
jgi:hypothetical protein